jgi:hypothetical protein
MGHTRSKTAIGDGFKPLGIGEVLFVEKSSVDRLAIGVAVVDGDDAALQIY